MTVGANGGVVPKWFVADQLHFNEEGYKLLAEAARPYLPKYRLMGMLAAQ